jgi:phosphonate transport system permease protein
MISRFSMNILRTMPDLFWAILFATAVGFGPFAGAVALSIFALAIMAKLFSETVDAIDTGPLEAVRATGASRFQAVRRAVWPQVRPNFVAYAFYIFELLIRASVVLGLVGAGGVGTSLNRWRQFFQYDRVMVLVLITLVIVLTLEALGALVRKRLS